MHDKALQRYARHILLPEIGVAGQRTIRKTRCLLIGMGGLGCAAATQLCMAGIGRLLIADADRVELSNLQRQTLFSGDDLGQAKIHVARTRLTRMNPDCDIEAIEQHLSPTNIHDLSASFDMIIDCSDNYTTRYACNHAALARGLPLISGAAIGWRGLVAAFTNRSGNGPCYACLFPAAMTARDESCSNGAVFAPLPAIVGTWQAAAALQMLLETNSCWSDHLLRIDATTMALQHVSMQRDPHCPSHVPPAASNPA